MSVSRVYPLIINKEHPDKLDFLSLSSQTDNLQSVDNLPLGINILAATSLPKVVDMRANMPPIVDQGSLGVCTACALCGLLGYFKKKQVFSRLFLYYCERVMENTINVDSGAYLSDGIKALTNYGVCLESSWPYIIKKFAQNPTTDCYIQASSYKALQVKNINDTLIDLKTILASGFPIACGIAVFKSFESNIVTKTGQVPIPSTKDQMLGGHAILLVGYDDVKQCFLFRNSWGTSWGIKGYGYIPYNYLLNPDWSTDFYTILKTT